MLAIAWTLSKDRHVRLDIFWQGFKTTTRRRVDRLGTLLLLMPMMVVILIASFGYVTQSWSIAEGSTELSGLPGLFLLKSLLLVMPMLVLVVGLARLFSRQD